MVTETTIEIVFKKIDAGKDPNISYLRLII